MPLGHVRIPGKVRAYKGAAWGLSNRPGAA
mgnify:CR=1 FL=1